MSARSSSRAKRGCAAALLCVLSGCMVGPDFLAPAAPKVTHYSSGTDPTDTVSAAGAAQHFTPGAPLAADWWRLFNSTKLDAVIAEALAQNPGLAAAQANLRASQDTLRSGYGIFFPSIAGNADAARQQYSALKVGQNLPPTIFNLFTLSATVSYVLDVFGGERRTVGGLAAQVDVQRAEEQATWLTLASNITNAIIARAAYQAEIDATQQLIDLQKDQVRLGEVQARAGIVPYANVLALQSQLASFEATIPQLQQKLMQSDDLLATLAGRTPAEWTSPAVALGDLTLPRDLPVSVPSDLVRQRPDILAAEATAHAASANIGVATAAMLPSITLNGSFGTNNAATRNLLAASGNFWSIGSNATTPIFEGGTLWFRRQAAIDSYQQAMASYRQTVLAAFGQVADTLRALEHDAATLQAQEAALDAAQQAVHLVQANYTSGIATYLDVLVANTQLHQSEINVLEAIASRYQDTVALFTALGGGWWKAQQSEPQGKPP